MALGGMAFALPLPDRGAPSAVPADAEEAAAVLEAAPERGAVMAPDVDPVGEPPPARPAPTETFAGSASYYADRFEGRTTASGVRFRQSELWAAHRTLPFGTRLRVTNPANGSEVEVVVVDRGPFVRGRVLDLSKAAARQLGFIRAGHTRVEVEVLDEPG